MGVRRREALGRVGLWVIGHGDGGGGGGGGGGRVCQWTRADNWATCVGCGGRMLLYET